MARTTRSSKQTNVKLSPPRVLWNRGPSTIRETQQAHSRYGNRLASAWHCGAVLIAVLLLANGVLSVARAGQEMPELESEPVADGPLWGEAVDGVQVRLTAEKNVWAFGEKPAFKMEVRNTGDKNLECSKPIFIPQLVEIDGTWTVHSGFPFFPQPFGPGQTYEQRIEIATSFILEGAPHKVSRLEPGKHTIRVGFLVLTPHRAGEDMAAYLDQQRPRSNPVEIMIEPALPGSEVGIDEAFADPDFAFLAVCTASETASVETPSKTSPPETDAEGRMAAIQGFKVAELMYAKHPYSAKFVSQYKIGAERERPIAKGERVIWILASMKGEPLLGQMPYRGIKALADTHLNRALVSTARAKVTSSGPRLSAEAALDEKIEAFSFFETPLPEVINFFKLLPQFENVNFIMVGDALEIGDDTVFVTRTMQNVTLRQALAAMVKPHGLDFAICYDSILISTPERVAAFLEEERIRPTRRRTRDLSHEEEELAEALDAGITAFSFEETPLFEVLNFLKLLPQFEDVNFVLDDDGLGDAEFFVTLAMQDVSLSTALTAMLRPRDLDFAIWNDAIFISTTERIVELTGSEPSTMLRPAN